MNYELNFFWSNLFPITFTALVGLTVVIYGIKRRKKLNEKGERYVGGLLPVQESHFIKSNQQTGIWFVFAFLCYLLAIWVVLIFIKDPSIWLKNSWKIIGLLLFFPLIGISAWYNSWVITDAKKRNMDIKSYYLSGHVIRHWFIRKNYPVVNNDIREIKSFQWKFIIMLAIWLAAALVILFFVVNNVDEIIKL